MAPFPTAAHRTGLADLPHPALGQASREGMHGPSPQARLVEVDHSHLSVDLGVTEAAGSADTKLVSPTEKPPSPFPEMPADSGVGLACVAEAEVLGPAQEKAVEPVPQFGPGGRISTEEQGIDLVLEPLLSFLRGLDRELSPPGLPMPRRTEGIA